MAFAPVSDSKKRSLFAAPKPNYKDYSGPPDGDYVRYVEGLLRWAEQEQERQRLKALGEQTRSQNHSDSHWGRSSAKPSVLTQLSAPQPGSTDSAMERWKRKAQAQAAKLQQNAQRTGTEARKQGAAHPAPALKASALSVVAMFAGLVLAGFFAPALLPVIIIAWVVFNVIRAVRTASSANQS